MPSPHPPPPSLFHLFPLSVCGLSTGKEKPTPSLCAGSHFHVKWGLSDLPTTEQPSSTLTSWFSHASPTGGSLSDPLL